MIQRLLITASFLNAFLCSTTSSQPCGMTADDGCSASAARGAEIDIVEERALESLEEELVQSEVSSLVQLQAQPKRKQLEAEVERTAGAWELPACVSKPSLLQATDKSSTAGIAAYPMKLCYIAQNEEGMPSPHYLPDPWLLKYPRSWVEKILELGSSKDHYYSFVGSVCRSEIQFEARRWVFSFAAQHFGDDDFLRATDCQATDIYSSMYVRRYERELLGVYDHTFDNFTSQVPSLDAMDDFREMPYYDEVYWKVMARSNFTLAPAGDSQYSYRFYEAMLAGSIPIVSDENHTWGLEGNETSQKLGWNYYVVSPGTEYVYRQDWVDDNRAKAIKYLTYMEGDNYP